MQDNQENVSVIDNFINIPDDLLYFLKQDTYSLLIKGRTGTGKTTLALTILRALKIKKNCLYISTRNSPDKIFQHFPWLNSFFAESKKSQLDESTETRTDLPLFVDGRLDEPAILYERITNQLMDTKSPMIIIDSWDSVGYMMDKEALITNTRVLQTWRERSGAKMIFIVDDPEDSTFDFLVDGIVELSQRYHDDRIVREIHISKLRGVRINRPSYVFSLHNSIFRSYSPYRLTEFSIILPSKVSKYETKNTTPLLFDESHITTGYPEFDKLLGGGFPLKSVVNIELDYHVNFRVALAFLNKIISNFAASGNPILLQPFEGVHRNYVESYLNARFSAQQKKDLIKILNHTQLKKTLAYFTPDKKYTSAKKQSDSFHQIVIKTKKKFPKKMLLNIMELDITHHSHKTEDINKINHLLVDFIRSNAELSIFITQHSQKNTLEYLPRLSDIRMRILEINGTLFLQSQAPWSPLYAIVVDKHRGHLDIELEPIV